MRRFLTFFKRTSSATKNPETVDIIVKKGNETYTIKDIKSLNVTTNDGTQMQVQFKCNPKTNLETKPEFFETPETKNIASDNIPDLAETARNFNDISSAVSKIGAGAVVTGSALYANSLREDSEVKRVAEKSVDEAVY